MKTLRSVAGLVLWLVIVAAVSLYGSLLTRPSVPTWYEQLNKPTFTPPGAVFGPVWTVLYILMAVAAWLVMRRTGQVRVAPALVLFLAQLGLNGSWSAVFFGLHSPGDAFVVIVALWLAILATLVAFWRVSAWAGVLLLPYLAWVSFASVLNYSLWRLNL